MTVSVRNSYHRLFGPARPRMGYLRRDLADYVLMICCCAAVLRIAYGGTNGIFWLGMLLCVAMIVMFPMRHGFALRMPLILRRPQDALYMLIYKLQNLKPAYLAGLAVLVIDNVLIEHTRTLPHLSSMMRNIALGLFYAHLGLISLYRTVILIGHLRRREHVGEVLSQTPWKGTLARQPNVTLHILHAYCTGLLAHVILLAPWYVVITHCQYSLVTMAAVTLIDVLIHIRHLHSYSRWFYRDHWLGHNSELEFLYLHGPHHDAIPSGLIGVSGNGYLEGLCRHTMGNPAPFYSPPFAFVLYTLEVLEDIKSHQYIPGLFPKLPRRFHEIAQHSTHHFARLAPYSIGLKVPRQSERGRRQGYFQFPPEAIMNSVSLDEELNGFEWDNPPYRRFLELFDKYQGSEPASARRAEGGLTG